MLRGQIRRSRIACDCSLWSCSLSGFGGPGSPSISASAKSPGPIVDGRAVAR